MSVYTVGEASAPDDGRATAARGGGGTPAGAARAAGTAAGAGGAAAGAATEAGIATGTAVPSDFPAIELHTGAESAAAAAAASCTSSFYRRRVVASAKEKSSISSAFFSPPPPEAALFPHADEAMLAATDTARCSSFCLPSSSGRNSGAAAARPFTNSYCRPPAAGTLYVAEKTQQRSLDSTAEASAAALATGLSSSSVSFALSPSSLLPSPSSLPAPLKPSDVAVASTTPRRSAAMADSSSIPSSSLRALPSHPSLFSCHFTAGLLPPSPPSSSSSSSFPLLSSSVEGRAASSAAAFPAARLIRPLDKIELFWEVSHRHGGVMICNCISLLTTHPVLLQHVETAARLLLLRHQVLRLSIDDGDSSSCVGPLACWGRGANIQGQLQQEKWKKKGKKKEKQKEAAAATKFGMEETSSAATPERGKQGGVEQLYNDHNNASRGSSKRSNSRNGVCISRSTTSTTTTCRYGRSRDAGANSKQVSFCDRGGSTRSGTSSSVSSRRSSSTGASFSREKEVEGKKSQSQRSTSSFWKEAKEEETQWQRELGEAPPEGHRKEGETRRQAGEAAEVTTAADAAGARLVTEGNFPPTYGCEIMAGNSSGSSNCNSHGSRFYRWLQRLKQQAGGVCCSSCKKRKKKVYTWKDNGAAAHIDVGPARFRLVAEGWGSSRLHSSIPEFTCPTSVAAAVDGRCSSMPGAAATVMNTCSTRAAHAATKTATITTTTSTATSTSAASHTSDSSSSSKSHRFLEEDDWIRAMAFEQAFNFDVQKGPLWRLRLLPSQPLASAADTAPTPETPTEKGEEAVTATSRAEAAAAATTTTSTWKTTSAATAEEEEATAAATTGDKQGGEAAATIATKGTSTETAEAAGDGGAAAAAKTRGAASMKGIGTDTITPHESVAKAKTAAAGSVAAARHFLRSSLCTSVQRKAHDTPLSSSSAFPCSSFSSSNSSPSPPVLNAFSSSPPPAGRLSAASSSSTSEPSSIHHTPPSPSSTPAYRYRTHILGFFHHATMDGLSRQNFWNELCSLLLYFSNLERCSAYVREAVTAALTDPAASSRAGCAVAAATEYMPPAEGTSSHLSRSSSSRSRSNGSSSSREHVLRSRSSRRKDSICSRQLVRRTGRSSSRERVLGSTSSRDHILQNGSTCGQQEREGNRPQSGSGSTSSTPSSRQMMMKSSGAQGRAVPASKQDLDAERRVEKGGRRQEGKEEGPREEVFPTSRTYSLPLPACMEAALAQSQLLYSRSQQKVFFIYPSPPPPLLAANRPPTSLSFSFNPATASSSTLRHTHPATLSLSTAGVVAPLNASCRNTPAPSITSTLPPSSARAAVSPASQRADAAAAAAFAAARRPALTPAESATKSLPSAHLSFSLSPSQSTPSLLASSLSRATSAPETPALLYLASGYPLAIPAAAVAASSFSSFASADAGSGAPPHGRLLPLSWEQRREGRGRGEGRDCRGGAEKRGAFHSSSSCFSSSSFLFSSSSYASAACLLDAADVPTTCMPQELTAVTPLPLALQVVRLILFFPRLLAIGYACERGLLRMMRSPFSLYYPAALHNANALQRRGAALHAAKPSSYKWRPAAAVATATAATASSSSVAATTPTAAAADPVKAITAAGNPAGDVAAEEEGGGVGGRWAIEEEGRTTSRCNGEIEAVAINESACGEEEKIAAGGLAAAAPQRRRGNIVTAEGEEKASREERGEAPEVSAAEEKESIHSFGSAVESAEAGFREEAQAKDLSICPPPSSFTSFASSAFSPAAGEGAAASAETTRLPRHWRFGGEAAAATAAAAGRGREDFTSLIKVEISKGMTKLLLQICRDHNTSMHGLFVAAASTALSRMLWRRKEVLEEIDDLLAYKQTHGTHYVAASSTSPFSSCAATAAFNALHSREYKSAKGTFCKDKEEEEAAATDASAALRLDLRRGDSSTLAGFSEQLREAEEDEDGGDHEKRTTAVRSRTTGMKKPQQQQSKPAPSLSSSSSLLHLQQQPQRSLPPFLLRSPSPEEARASGTSPVTTSSPPVTTPPSPSLLPAISAIAACPPSPSASLVAPGRAPPCFPRSVSAAASTVKDAGSKTQTSSSTPEQRRSVVLRLLLPFVHGYKKARNACERLQLLLHSPAPCYDALTGLRRSTADRRGPVYLYTAQAISGRPWVLAREKMKQQSQQLRQPQRQQQQLQQDQQQKGRWKKKEGEGVGGGISTNQEMDMSLPPHRSSQFGGKETLEREEKIQKEKKQQQQTVSRKEVGELPEITNQQQFHAFLQRQMKAALHRLIDETGQRLAHAVTTPSGRSSSRESNSSSRRSSSSSGNLSRQQLLFQKTRIQEKVLNKLQSSLPLVPHFSAAAAANASVERLPSGITHAAAAAAAFLFRSEEEEAAAGGRRRAEGGREEELLLAAGRPIRSGARRERIPTCQQQQTAPPSPPTLVVAAIPAAAASGGVIRALYRPGACSSNSAAEYRHFHALESILETIPCDSSEPRASAGSDICDSDVRSCDGNWSTHEGGGMYAQAAAPAAAAENGAIAKPGATATAAVKERRGKNGQEVAREAAAPDHLNSLPWARRMESSTSLCSTATSWSTAEAATAEALGVCTPEQQLERGKGFSKRGKSSSCGSSESSTDRFKSFWWKNPKSHPSLQRKQWCAANLERQYTQKIWTEQQQKQQQDKERLLYSTWRQLRAPLLLMERLVSGSSRCKNHCTSRCDLQRGSEQPQMHVHMQHVHKHPSEHLLSQNTSTLSCSTGFARSYTPAADAAVEAGATRFAAEAAPAIAGYGDGCRIVEQQQRLHLQPANAGLGSYAVLMPMRLRISAKCDACGDAFWKLAHHCTAEVHAILRSQRPGFFRSYKLLPWISITEYLSAILDRRRLVLKLASLPPSFKPSAFLVSNVGRWDTNLLEEFERALHVTIMHAVDAQMHLAEYRHQQLVLHSHSSLAASSSSARRGPRSPHVIASTSPKGTPRRLQTQMPDLALRCSYSRTQQQQQRLHTQQFQRRLASCSGRSIQTNACVTTPAVLSRPACSTTAYEKKNVTLFRRDASPVSPPPGAAFAAAGPVEERVRVEAATHQKESTKKEENTSKNVHSSFTMSNGPGIGTAQGRATANDCINPTTAECMTACISSTGETSEDAQEKEIPKDRVPAQLHTQDDTRVQLGHMQEQHQTSQGKKQPICTQLRQPHKLQQRARPEDEPPGQDVTAGTLPQDKEGEDTRPAFPKLEPFSLKLESSWSVVSQHNMGLNYFAHNIVTVDGRVNWSLQYHTSLVGRELAACYAQRILGVLEDVCFAYTAEHHRGGDAAGGG